MLSYEKVGDDDADEDEEEDEENLSRDVTALSLDGFPDEIFLQIEFANHHHQNLQA